MQSKQQSLVEAVSNTLFGFVTTIIVSYPLYWLFNVEVNFGQVTGLTAAFTLVSVIRNYIIRRWFNKSESGNKDVDFMKFIHFFFPPNDWKIVWSENGIWTHKGEHMYNVIYNIEYSSYRHKYKLISSGEQAKDHTMYPIACKKLAMFNSLTYQK